MVETLCFTNVSHLVKGKVASKIKGNVLLAFLTKKANNCFNEYEGIKNILEFENLRFCIF